MRFLKTIFTLCLLASTIGFTQDDVRIPNILTPNEDGINDVFSIRTNGYENLSCTIFNRYGSTIYRYFGLNGTWDGFTHAGVKVTPGTYFIFVELTRENGEIETRQGTLQVQY